MLHTIDICIIALYLVTCLVLGLYKSREIKNIRDFALGGKYTPTVVLVATIFSTNIGAGASMGVIERIYSMGLIFAAARMISPLFWIITAKIFTPNIEQFKDCISMSDVMEKLYGKFGRWCTNICAVLLAVGGVAAQVVAIGYICNYFLEINHTMGIFIAFATVIIYSSLGGARALAITDVFQFGIFYIAIPVACAIALHDVGGLEGLKTNLPENYLTLDLSGANLWIFLSFVFYALMPPADSAFIQRFLMANSSRQLNRTFYIIAGINIPFVMVLCMIGFIVRAKAPELDGSNAFLYLISNYLPVGVVGFLVAGLLSIVMSTANAMINTASVLFAHDIGKMIFKENMSQKQELLTARVMTVLIGVFSIFLALRGGTVFEFMLFAENFWYPLMLIPVTLGFIGYRISQKSFIIAIISALIVTSYTRYIVGEFDIKSMVLGILANAAGILISHFYFNFKEMIASISLPKIRTNLKNYSVAALVSFAPKNIVKTINKSVRGHGAHYYTFCIFGILYYTAPLFSTALTGNATVDLAVYFRIISACMCLIICFHEYFSKNFAREWLPTIWYVSLLFCLPMVSTYSVLVTNTDLFWVVSAIFSTFMLAMLVDLKSFIVLQTLGITIGYIIYRLMDVTSPVVIPVDGNFSVAAYLYCFASLILAAIMKKVQDDKISTLEMIGGAVAHEVKTPLAATHMAAEAMNTLVEGAFKNQNKGKITFKDEDYLMLKDFSAKIKKSTTNGIAAVDMILSALKRPALNEITSGESQNIAISLSKALEELNLKASDAKRIVIEPLKEFSANCSEIYLRHLFINLINNFIRHAGEDAVLSIVISDHRIYFKDNGVGIAPDDINRIFQKFTTCGKNPGTGIGLHFCSMIMESMGGSIECRSMLGEGTVFTLTFPDN